MRKLAGLVVIVAALILGSYYGMGVITERALKKNIAMIDQSNGLILNIEKYQRGWFRSHALINGRLYVPAKTNVDQAGVTTTVAAQDVQIQMPLDIYHGPIMFVGSRPMFGLGYAHSDMTLPAVYAEQFSREYTAESTAPTLGFSMFISYLNKSVLHANVPAFKLIAREGNMQFQWSGMRGDLAVSSHRNKLRGSVSLDGMNLLKEKTSVLMGPVLSQYNLHKTSSGLYFGDANVNLSNLLIKQDVEPEIAVQQLNVNSMSNIENNLCSSRFKLTLNKLTVDKKIYGPAVLDVSIINLDANVLAKINEQSNAIQQGTDAQRQQAMLSLLPELPTLVSKGAELEIKEFSVVMPEGNINGTLLLSLPAAKVNNPFQLIQKIQGQGKVVFADAVLKQLMSHAAKKALQDQVSLQTQAIVSTPSSTPAAATVLPPPADIEQQAVTQANERITAMVQSGLLSLQGSDYVVEFKLEAGQLSVNGKPFSPAMMKF